MKLIGSFGPPPPRRAGRAILIALIALLGCATVVSLLPQAAAQTDASDKNAASTSAPTAEATDGVEMGQGVPTIAKLFQTSPYINAALLALSVVATAMFIYLLLSMTGATFNPPRFNDDVTKLIINRQFEQAINLCQNNADIFASSVIQRVVENRDKDHGVLMDILTAEGRRRGEIVWNRIGYLAEISNIAPMLGLLGTVIGMMKVFFTLTTRTVGEKVAQLSAGIAEAMSTTMFGLIVAIAAGVFYTIARARATTMLSEVEQLCHTIADHTQRSAADPRLRRIDALADAARQKVAKAHGPAPVKRDD